jgi:hypothetical protein
MKKSNLFTVGIVVIAALFCVTCEDNSGRSPGEDEDAYSFANKFRGGENPCVANPAAYGCPDYCPSTQSGCPGYCPSTQAGCPGYCPSTQAGCPGYCPSTQAGCPGYCPSTQAGCPGYCPSTQAGCPGYIDPNPPPSFVLGANEAWIADEDYGYIFRQNGALVEIYKKDGSWYGKVCGSWSTSGDNLNLLVNEGYYGNYKIGTYVGTYKISGNTLTITTSCCGESIFIKRANINIQY